MLPSRSSARRTARPQLPLVADGVHSQSHTAARSSAQSAPTRGHHTLAAQLRWFLCGCGLLYIVLLWYWSMWTTRVISEHTAPATDTNLPVKVQAVVVQSASTSTTKAPTTREKASISVLSPTASTATSVSSSTRLSTTSAPDGIDLEWLRSLVLTTPEEPESTAAAVTSVPLSFEEYTARMDELEHSRQTLQTTVDMLKEQLAKVRVQITNHEIVLADEEAKAARPLSAASLASTPREFNCVGWRATVGCGPRGHRVPKNDRLCAQRAPPNTAGYCEIEDVETKERFRVMETSCDSFRWEARLNCLDAHHYLSFPAIANNLLAQQQHVQQQQHNQQQPPSRGIVIVVYPTMLPSAYALLRTLRRLGCQLDVELWYSPDELQDAATHPIVHAMVERFGPVTLRAIDDGRAHGFTNKIHAIRHSAFDHVLFLDADNVPVKDPTYLFELPQFTASGALFWPDFWHPNHTIFAIHERSLVWEYLDLPFVDMFEQESGQLVIDKTRSRTAFALLDLYAYHQPNMFEKLKLVHGDKDLFRFAWLKSNTSFYMVQHPPAVAGTVIDDMFCGQTMAQFDPNGELLFLHRNAKKLEGRHAKLPHTLVPNEPTPETPSEYEVDPEIWTHLQRLKVNTTRADYTIEIYKGSPKFPDGQYCYGQPKPTTPHFEIVRFADLPERTIENEIRGYAIEATDLLRDAATTTVKREETRND